MRSLAICLTILMLSTSLVTEAQNQNFGYFWDTKSHDKGQLHFSYGYGFPRVDNGRFDFHKEKTSFRVEGVGPFILKAEYGLSRQLSIGLSATYTQYTSDWEEQRYDNFHQRNLWFSYGTKLRDIGVMLRLNYHWVVTPRSDLYVGGGMGYNSWKSEDFTSYPAEDSTFNALFKDPGAFASELTLGYRYYFRQRNALFVEVGYGKSIVQAGFVFKFLHRKRQ